jgi:hypothetical protein
LLQDGSVLAVGGYGLNGQPVASAEIYDPSTETWTRVPDLSGPRAWHTATRLANGKVLIVGGNIGGYISSAELYDPHTRTWSRTGSINQPYYWHTATLLHDGKVLLVGSFWLGNNTATELYDASTGMWTFTGQLSRGRVYHTATLLPDGKVLVVGGYDNPSSTFTDAAELYDPISGRWTPVPGIAVPRAGHTATLLPSGNVLIAGGGNESGGIRTLELYAHGEPSNAWPYLIPDSGGVARQTPGASVSLQVGYASIQSDTTMPAGLVMFGFRRNNILISETAVPVSAPLKSGRIPAEISGEANTGLAIVNPNDSAATVSFFFTDSEGNDLGAGITTIVANHQLAKFLNEPPYNRAAPFLGTFSFTSNVPVGVIALRGFTNERDEFLTSTLPVIDTDATPGSGPQVVPHYADGGGWTTQILLVNPTSTAVTGNLQFVNPDGTPASVTVAGVSSASVPYSVSPRSSEKISTTGITESTIIGSVHVVPTSGVAPTPFAIFAYRPAGITVSEAGVTVTSGTAFRMYAESSRISGQPGGIQSGIVVANLSASAAIVTFELTQLDGTVVSGPVRTTLAGFGQTSKLLAELFPELPNPFQGLLRITTPSSGVSVAGLRARYNERNEFLITTTPPTPETSSATANRVIFPFLADGGGFATQFILFGRNPGFSSGTLHLHDPSGHSLNLSLR